MSDVCNFNCVYCCNRAKLTCNPKRVNIPFLLDCFGRVGGTLVINMTGGEPFLYPHYVELCAGLTKDHFITINTNLSTSNVYEFADEVDPSRVLYIVASVHILHRETRKDGLSEYLDKILCLQANGFKVVASYVAYPALLQRMCRDFALLRNAGVSNLQVEAFGGECGGRSYPQAYSNDERTMLKSLGMDCDDFAVLEGTNRYRGRLCLAGIKSFALHENGNLYRCNQSSRLYGNLWKGGIRVDHSPRPCPFSACICPFYGMLNCLSITAGGTEVFGEILCEKGARVRKRAVTCITKPSLVVKEIRRRVSLTYS
jgi:MoaA/NifB/PqqE/SkfB family radical SAM enzyme